VFLRVAGVEVKMERHLLGRPHQAGKMGFLVSGPNGGAPAAFEETLSAKDRRMRQVKACHLLASVVRSFRLAHPHPARTVFLVVPCVASASRC
jgi:hypothetical protein